MSFDEKITALAQKIPSLIDLLETEEATKNALVMPFIDALGYDIFNPKEVIPEFTADVGTKKGEKVDYAIMQDGEVIILIECKQANSDLNEENISQLFRYFTVTKARIAILTNGIHYRFFSDLDEKNKMDARPFLDLDMQNIRENLLDEVRKLAKERFDLDRMLSTANELKYTSAIKKTLSLQVEKPDDEFVRFFFNATNSGSRFTATAKEQFAVFVQKAFQQFIRESVSDRLRSALQKEDDKEKKIEEQEELAQNENGIVTTEDELEGFQIVRAIICQKVKPNRIAHRDTKSYFGILLDDNNRKPICRLYFNTTQKYIGLFNKNKKETKQPINELTDIYKHTEQLLEAACCYDGGE
ncbi:MAG: type I restriction enzyme HsdR N-terminal domain-containing protein [Thermodesulfobacteriota bacterium]|nr:type I restriction enzyme HsdR N-terminal domain-containing protein [Thermodesulfobacteriota bacterium]